MIQRQNIKTNLNSCPSNKSWKHKNLKNNSERKKKSFYENKMNFKNNRNNFYLDIKRYVTKRLKKKRLNFKKQKKRHKSQKGKELHF